MAGEKIYIADKETLDKVYNILASDPVYGFIEHNDILSPSSRIEYIGLNKNFTPLVRNKQSGGMALNSWADFPIIKANKPYMVKADGTPDTTNIHRAPGGTRYHIRTHTAPPQPVRQRLRLASRILYR